MGKYLGKRKRNSRTKKLVNEWPIVASNDYVTLVNTIQDKSEVDAIRKSINKNQPLGKLEWVTSTAKLFDLESTLRKPGRPKKNGS